MYPNSLIASTVAMCSCVQARGCVELRVLKPHELDDDDPNGYAAAIRRWRTSTLISLFFGVPAVVVMVAFMVLGSLDAVSMRAAVMGFNESCPGDHCAHPASASAAASALPSLSTPIATSFSNASSSLSSSSIAAAARDQPSVGVTAITTAMTAATTMNMGMQSMFMICPGLNLENLLLFLLATPVQVRYA